jgi:hypothetical protein
LYVKAPSQKSVMTLAPVEIAHVPALCLFAACCTAPPVFTFWIVSGSNSNHPSSPKTPQPSCDDVEPRNVCDSPTGSLVPMKETQLRAPTREFEIEHVQRRRHTR